MSATLGKPFEAALVYAAHLHAEQKRKGTDIPYVSHLLAVTSLVLEAGGDEDEAIAALLHDGPEDQGGLATLAKIRMLFGQGVGDIVAACSDTFEAEKPAWKARKEAYLAHLHEAAPSVLRRASVRSAAATSSARSSPRCASTASASVGRACSTARN